MHPFIFFPIFPMARRARSSTPREEDAGLPKQDVALNAWQKAHEQYEQCGGLLQATRSVLQRVGLVDEDAPLDQQAVARLRTQKLNPRQVRALDQWEEVYAASQTVIQDLQEATDALERTMVSVLTEHTMIQPEALLDIQAGKLSFDEACKQRKASVLDGFDNENPAHLRASDYYARLGDIAEGDPDFEVRVYRGIATAKIAAILNEAPTPPGGSETAEDAVSTALALVRRNDDQSLALLLNDTKRVPDARVDVVWLDVCAENRPLGLAILNRLDARRVHSIVQGSLSKGKDEPLEVMTFKQIVRVVLNQASFDRHPKDKGHRAFVSAPFILKQLIGMYESAMTGINSVSPANKRSPDSAGADASVVGEDAMKMQKEKARAYADALWKKVSRVFTVIGRDRIDAMMNISYEYSCDPEVSGQAQEDIAHFCAQHHDLFEAKLPRRREQKEDLVTVGAPLDADIEARNVEEQLRQFDDE
ncbi:MAG: hypothetical protein G01um101425_301 [Candidatus Peregrinibacteria bacterium Gr01-1014_25]|nr:MAG: hypothetical protein G01um101425_301 [Candidatus Peregrinibacteria bacterium Gr01-1014_25]